MDPTYSTRARIASTARQVDEKWGLGGGVGEGGRGARDKNTKGDGVENGEKSIKTKRQARTGFINSKNAKTRRVDKH